MKFELYLNEPKESKGSQYSHDVKQGLWENNNAAGGGLALLEWNFLV
jgi:hypothetical protein